VNFILARHITAITLSGSICKGSINDRSFVSDQSLRFKHSIKYAKQFFHIAHCLDKTDIIVYNDIKLFIQAFNSIIYKGSESDGHYQ